MSLIPYVFNSVRAGTAHEVSFKSYLYSIRRYLSNLEH